MAFGVIGRRPVVMVMARVVKDSDRGSSTRVGDEKVAPVGRAKHVRREHIARWAVRHEAPIEHQKSITDRRGLIEVMRRHENGRARGAQISQNAEYGLRGGPVNTGERFVEDVNRAALGEKNRLFILEADMTERFGKPTEQRKSRTSARYDGGSDRRKGSDFWARWSLIGIRKIVSCRCLVCGSDTFKLGDSY